jgi:hypothetical protein
MKPTTWTHNTENGQKNYLMKNDNATTNYQVKLIKQFVNLNSGQAETATKPKKKPIKTRKL